jgi:putative MATE family efflux protein
VIQKSSSLNREIITLAWPAVMQSLVRSLIPILDSFWIGKLGAEYLAAITVGSFLSWGVFALMETMPIGTNALIAQATGAGQFETRKEIAAQNLLNAFLYGILISLIIIPVLPALYDLTKLDETKSILANEYLLPLLIGLPILILSETSSAVFRGSGDTKTPFLLLVMTAAFKIIITPLFIFGHGFIPELGMMGASVTTLMAYSFSFIIAFFLLKKRNLRKALPEQIKIFFSYFREKIKIFTETLKIGLPLSLEGLTFVMIYVFVSRFVADFGTVGLAALGIGHRSEAIPYQVGEGFSVTSSIMVGFYIGAGNPKRAENAAWRILLIACCSMLFYSLVLFFLPSQVAGAFTTDAEVIRTARVYNMIASFSIFFAMSETIFTGAFAGASNSLPPLIISLPVTASRIPLCALLAPVYGMNGIWIAIFSTSILKGILIALWFYRGKWKVRKFTLQVQESPYDLVERH